MKVVFSVIAGLLSIAGYFLYILAILRKETKLAKASWIIWAILAIIVLTGMLVKQSVNGQIMAVALGTTIIAVLLLKYGTPGWTKIDKFCLFGAGIAIMLWFIFSDPIFGIMASLTVMFIGSVPAFAWAWSYPSRENKSAWILFWFSSICAIIAIPKWDLANAAQPIVFLVIMSIMTCILCIRSQSLVKA